MQQNLVMQFHESEKIRIIESFFTTKDPGKGLGLRLSIAYKIVQEHKGILEYES